MKNIIISVLMLISLQIVNGQDKIITIQNDTIHCRIISISPPNIQYEQMEDGDIVSKYIPIEQVFEYYQNPQSEKINSNYYTTKQKPKPVNKHYFGFSGTNGVGKYEGAYSSKWDQDFFGVGFEYAHRRDNSELNIGLASSSAISIFVPLTAKLYLGKYIFIGLGVLAGYEESLCLGAHVLTGAEYVFENGFSLSLTPYLRYSLMNVENKDNTGYMDSEILKYAGVSIGVGFRF